MSKPYFTKYLPVEGEIKPDDDFKHSIKDGIHTNTDITSINHPDYQKVKLFLCSRDIKVGDKQIHLPSGEIISTIHDEIDLELCTVGFKSIGLQPVFKVIGEISPDTTWVKEGDEFDEDEIRNAKGLAAMGAIEYNYWEIKGPCGHFH